MKKISILLCVLAFLIISTNCCFAQVKDNFNFDKNNIKDFPTTSPRDNVSVNIKDVNNFIHKSMQYTINIEHFINKIDQNFKNNNVEAFTLYIDELNNYILANFKDETNINNKYILISALSKNIRQGLVTPEVLQDTSDFFMDFISNTKCSITENDNEKTTCKMIALALMTLAYEKNLYVEQGLVSINQNQEFLSATNMEIAYFIEEISKKNWGNLETTTYFVPYLVRSGAYAGGIESLRTITKNLMGKVSSWKISPFSYKNKEDNLQVTLFNAIREYPINGTGELLLEYVDSPHLAAKIYSTINASYFYPPTKENNKFFKKRIEYFYCHHTSLNRDADPEDDLRLKQDLSYAYWGGSADSVLYDKSNSSCVIVYPKEKNPNLVAQKWANIMMTNAAIDLLTAPIGPIALQTLNKAAQFYKKGKSIMSVALPEAKIWIEFQRKLAPFKHSGNPQIKGNAKELFSKVEAVSRLFTDYQTPKSAKNAIDNFSSVFRDTKGMSVRSPKSIKRYLNKKVKTNAREIIVITSEHQIPDYISSYYVMVSEKALDDLILRVNKFPKL